MVWLSTKENLTLLVIALFSLTQGTKAKPMNSRKLKRDSGGTDADILLSRFTQSSPAKVSYYGKYPVGTSSCSLDPVPPLLSEKNWILAAVSKGDFLNSLICGTCLRISVIDLASREDPEDIFAAVIDQCNDCQKGEINLYTEGRETQKANYEAIDCGRKIADSLIVRIQHATESSKKVQIRNSLLPIVSLECFSNGKWKCMPREIDNYFLYKEINPQTSVQFRATSISGQTIGFTLEDLNSIKEVKLSQQFQPFHTATLTGKNVSTQCQDQTDFDRMNLVGDLASRGKGFQHEDINITEENDTVKTLKDTKADGRIPNTRNLTKEFEVYQPAINTSFCKAKADGTYAQDSDCEQFILCTQGKTLRKKCPNGLRYNAKEGVCDWATNVMCGELNGRPRKTFRDEANSENDEEIYTKRFIGRTKLNGTVYSVVEN